MSVPERVLVFGGLPNWSAQFIHATDFPWVGSATSLGGSAASMMTTLDSWEGIFFVFPYCRTWASGCKMVINALDRSQTRLKYLFHSTRIVFGR